MSSDVDPSPVPVFTTILRPRLRERLVKLGAPLANAYNAANLAVRLSDALVADAVGTPGDHAIARKLARDGRGGRPTQVDLLPCAEPYVDFGKPERFPDEVYAHALLMVGAALDMGFQMLVARVVREHNAAWERETGEAGTARHSAAQPKAFARVMTKVRSDYRYDATPRAQHNVDVVRCMVTAGTPEELLAVSGRLAKSTFGGAVRVKNLFVAPHEERAERFHLLPLMLTVDIGAEDGVTYGEFVGRSEVRKAFDAYVAARDVTVPPHRWAEATAAARSMLESDGLAGTPVRLLGELQMVLSNHAKVRHQMHEVYKAYRAESAQLLWEDYARTSIREGDEGEGGALGDFYAQEPPTLCAAAGLGNRPAVETFLRQGMVDVNDVVDGSTALVNAAESGFTDVVKVLVVDGAADVNLANAAGMTPLIMSAQRGHADAVRILLDAGADVNHSPGGTTPLMWAAEAGYTDVVRILLGANAHNTFALFCAAECGHTDVVRALIDAGADVNQQRPGTGSTPLIFAAKEGHEEVMRVLIDAGANVHITNVFGLSAHTANKARASSAFLHANPLWINRGR